jgi:hypothetical protein
MKNEKHKDDAPTWKLISTYFTATDIACMLNYGIDLSSCSDVRDNGPEIYQQVKSGAMPKGGTPWSVEWVTNFKAWLDSNPQCQ